MFPQITIQDKEIKDLKAKEKPYKFTIGKSLYLLINPNGSKYWRMKYIFLGKEKTLSFGVYPEISIEEAIYQRDIAKELLKKHIDPVLHRKLQKQQQEEVEDKKSELEISLKNDGNLIIKKNFKSILITKEELQSLKSFIAPIINLDNKDAK